MTHLSFVPGLVALLILAAPIPGHADEGKLVHEGVIGGSLEEVWGAFTTEVGLESWMAPHADIVLEIGGLMRTNYDPKGTIDDPNSIHNRIICFDPMKMISYQVAKTPENFPFPNEIKKMWTIVYFESKGDKETTVRSVCLGFRNNEESKKMREFFQRGNALTIEELRKRFSKGVK